MGFNLRVLTIAPHPDDEILGCGGTIIRHIKNNDAVFLCYVTKCYTPLCTEEFLKKRSKELEKVSQILGIKKYYTLDQPTVMLDTIPQKKLNNLIHSVVLDVKPDIVYIPFKGDLNKDHRIVFESSLVALRPKSLNVKRILSYEVLSSTEWGQPIAYFNPSVYVDISDFIDIKIQAFSIYESELKPPPSPRSIEAITCLAKKRGFECGLEYAEAFHLVREVIR